MMDNTGRNRRIILDSSKGVYSPGGLALYQNTVFYIDTVQEKVVKVMSPNFDDPVDVTHESPHLKSIKVYTNRPSKI